MLFQKERKNVEGKDSRNLIEGIKKSIRRKGEIFRGSSIKG